MKCKRCGAITFASSGTCAICGYGSPNRRVYFVVGGFVVVLGFLMVWMSFSLDNIEQKQRQDPWIKEAKAIQASENWKNKPDPMTAYRMMTVFVQRSLKAPSTAKFPSFFDKETNATYLNDQRYRVTSYVDAQNTFGAMVRTRFWGELEQTSENDWNLRELKMDQN